MLRKELLETGRDRQRIDWGRIGQAVKYYEDLGYEYIEVPWTVSPEASQVTFPGEAITCQAGDLVGSAEQAFLDLMMMGKQLPEKVVAVSPCFRIEPEYTDLHHLSFMKVELFSTKNIWTQMLEDAREFFKSCGIKGIRSILVPPFVQRDLVVGGIEVGSYGYRTHKNFEWSYGTGLAEPRTSVAMRH